MKLNVARKVREINLKPHEFLLPVFEVIVNAIDAIEYANNKDGLIEIEIIRDKSQIQIQDKNLNLNHPIDSIIVLDNGVGFNEKAFSAFNNAYTDFKYSKGGKGVGRFTVLSAFKKMEIESVFEKNKTFLNRNFNFSVEKEIFQEEEPKISNKLVTGSKITLSNYLPQFKEKSKISLDDFCNQVVYHCLIFFLTDNMPKIIIKDEDKKNNLSDYYNIFLEDYNQTAIAVKSKKFKLYFLKKKALKGSNQIHLCAHNRLVDTIPLKSLIPNLYNPLEYEGEKYYLDVFVTGDYLNDNLNEIRNSFTIPKKNTDLSNDLYQDVSIEGILHNVKQTIEEKYEAIIMAIEDVKLEKINEYVLSGEGIEYRHLLDYTKELSNISPEKLTPERLDTELHKINYQLEKEHKKEINKVLKKSIDQSNDYAEELKRVLIDESKFSQSKLADYIIRRKVIIRVFERYLDWQQDKFKKEEDLHNIIFPMGGDSDSIPFNKHNLWLLDERLTFHTYVASDKKIKSTKTIDSDSLKEPDLSLFKKQWVYAPDDEFSSLVIFEFKRPGREMTAEDLDKQILEYFQILMDGKTRNYRGKNIDIEKSTPKFGYIICDVDKPLKEKLKTWHSYKVTPNGTLYKYWDEINLYMEILSFDSILTSAKERHKAFFKMLGIDKENTNLI